MTPEDQQAIAEYASGFYFNAISLIVLVTGYGMDNQRVNDNAQTIFLSRAIYFRDFNCYSTSIVWTRFTHEHLLDFVSSTDLNPGPALILHLLLV